jgi:hypothetical protein
VSLFRTARRPPSSAYWAHQGQAWASRTSTLPSRTRVRYAGCGAVAGPCSNAPSSRLKVLPWHGHIERAPARKHRVDQTLTHGLQAAKASVAPCVPPAARR